MALASAAAKQTSCKGLVFNHHMHLRRFSLLVNNFLGLLVCRWDWHNRHWGFLNLFGNRQIFWEEFDCWRSLLLWHFAAGIVLHRLRLDGRFEFHVRSVVFFAQNLFNSVSLQFFQWKVELVQTQSRLEVEYLHRLVFKSRDQMLATEMLKQKHVLN
jgi:hypothetical protein